MTQHQSPNSKKHNPFEEANLNWYQPLPEFTRPVRPSRTRAMPEPQPVRAQAGLLGLPFKAAQAELASDELRALKNKPTPSASQFDMNDRDWMGNRIVNAEKEGLDMADTEQGGLWGVIKEAWLDLFYEPDDAPSAYKDNTAPHTRSARPIGISQINRDAGLEQEGFANAQNQPRFDTGRSTQLDTGLTPQGWLEGVKPDKTLQGEFQPRNVLKQRQPVKRQQPVLDYRLTHIINNDIGKPGL